MKMIKLRPEYECWPLWYTGPDVFGDIDPRELGLSDNLIKEIEEWTEAYDATLNQEYPPDSGFNSSDEERVFVDTGFSLAKKISDELRGRYHIEFKYNINRKIE